MVCSIGELTGGSCRNRVKRELGEEAPAWLQLFQIDELDGNLSHNFSTTEQVCQNVTFELDDKTECESWFTSKRYHLLEA